MKSQICSVCLKSGMLCRTCREKLEKGLIGEADVKVSRTLVSMSDSVKALRDVTLVKVAESPDLAVIVCARGDAAKVIGREGLVAKALEKELGKRVSIVEEANDVKDFISALLRPAQVAGINVVYRGGAEALRVLVKRGRASRMPYRDFRETVKLLYGKDVELADA